MRLKEINPTAPHQAIISMRIEILERLPNGQVIGPPIDIIGKVYTVIGKNLTECKEELQKFLLTHNLIKEKGE
jgi:hypothetical protein